MPTDAETSRLIGQFQEFMTTTRQDMRDIKDGLKANTSAITTLALDVSTLKTEKSTEEKTKRKWPQFLLLPAIGGGGATVAWNGKLIAGYISRMLG